ncbi:MAG: ATP synthase F1 subunit gamma [Candidatus Peregrinibacteria bacterium]
MSSARDIKRRIKGVRSTGKITKAMEMISGVKMRRAVESVMAIRPYAQEMLGILQQISKAMQKTGGDTLSHPFLSNSEGDTDLYVVVTSNRGLCGPFNTNVIKFLFQILKERQGRQTKFIIIGKKGEQVLMRAQGIKDNVVATFHDILVQPTPLGMRAVAQIIAEELLSKRVHRVEIIWTQYLSPLLQKVRNSVLFPIDEKKVAQEIADTSSEEIQKEYAPLDFIIEPSPQVLLEKIIPQFLEMELLYSLLESNASKEALQMMAMKQATDAANDMVASLNLSYNQIRQQKITQEIAELCAGMEALQR